MIGPAYERSLLRLQLAKLWTELRAKPLAGSHCGSMPTEHNWSSESECSAVVVGMLNSLRRLVQTLLLRLCPPLSSEPVRQRYAPRRL